MGGMIEKDPSGFRALREKDNIKDLADKVAALGQGASTDPAKAKEFEQSIKGILASCGTIRNYFRGKNKGDEAAGDAAYLEKVQPFEPLVKSTAKAAGIPESVALEAFRNPPLDDEALNASASKLVGAAKASSPKVAMADVPFGLNRDALSKMRQQSQPEPSRGPSMTA